MPSARRLSGRNGRSDENSALEYVAGKATQCDSTTMKKRDDQITLRIAGTLRTALEDEAAQRNRGLSNLIRKILIDHTSQRIAERPENAA